MVHVAARGDVPVRLGPGVRHVPDYGPSVMSRDVYADPVRFDLEREKVLGRNWIIAGRSTDVPNGGLDKLRGPRRDSRHRSPG